ncbi:hypothetical protein [Aliamphritea spongicola]|nr:hypothetical protein [Aliamphritea spongicola]
MRSDCWPPGSLHRCRKHFCCHGKNDAYNFPVVREAIGHADALYGFKSGFDRAGQVLGVKSGGYWPGNAANGLTNHQSTVILFDPNTGKLKALVGGNYLTAVRTAASSAVSIAHLARKDAKVLGMVGAGHQSTFQLRAAVEQRNFEKWLPGTHTLNTCQGCRLSAMNLACHSKRSAAKHWGPV